MMVIVLQKGSIYYSSLRNPCLKRMNIKQWATYPIVDYRENLIHEGLREKEREEAESFVLPDTNPRKCKVWWKLGFKEWAQMLFM